VIAKKTMLVTFPAELTLRLGAAPFLYSLSAVIVHSGDTFVHGHYYVLVKNAATGEWRKMNDRIVSPPLTLMQVLSEQPYILLYTRNSPAGEAACAIPPQFVLPQLPDMAPAPPAAAAVAPHVAKTARKELMDPDCLDLTRAAAEH
jgi:hypothetical protein